MNTEQICDSGVIEETHVCPWQMGRFFDNCLRPFVHNPQKMFGPYVQTGMKVLDVGCGRGFASLGLARLIGEDGLVISVDLQPKMLDMVQKRATKAGLSNRIHTYQCNAACIGAGEEFDFAVAFFMLHEVPDIRSFITELYQLLKPGGRLFITEPKIHVSRRDFENVVELAQMAGFEISERAGVRLGRTVVLVKGAAIDEDNRENI